MPRDSEDRAGVESRRWQQAQEHEAEYWARADVAGRLARTRRWHREAFDELAARLPEDALVLEVGSGPACHARNLSRGRVLHTDPLMAEYRRQHPALLPEGRAVAAMGEALPCPDGALDAVVCVNALDHARSPRCCLREMARVLRPGGWLLLSLYTHSHLLLGVRRALERHLPRAGSAPHPNTYTLAEIRADLRPTFEVVWERCVHRRGGPLSGLHRQYWVFLATPMEAAGEQAGNSDVRNGA